MANQLINQYPPNATYPPKKIAGVPYVFRAYENPLVSLNKASY